MPFTATPLRFLSQLRVGLDELAYLEGRNDELARHERLLRFERTGFLVPANRAGAFDYAWHAAGNNAALGEVVITHDSLTGFVYPAPIPTTLYAIDAEGYLLEHDGDGSTVVATVPDDGVWYTLVCRRVLEMKGPGTITLTAGSDVVTGTLTRFERYEGYTDGGYQRGTQIRVDVGDTAFAGNAQTYEIDTIVNDGELTLRSATALPTDTEADVPFRVAGRFFGTVPADPDIHSRWIMQYELVARTCTPAAGDMLIADVMWDSGTYSDVLVIDKRRYNVAIPRSLGTNLRTVVSPSFFWDGTAVVRQAREIAAPAADVAYMNLAPAREAGQAVAVYTEGANTKSATWDPETDTWTAGANIDAATGLTPAIVRVPCPNVTDFPTHLVFYIKAGVMYVRRVFDDAASVSAEVSIWDAPSVAPSDTLLAPAPIVLLSGRVLILCGYYDDSAAAGAGQWQLRWVFSDDNGVTWETNGHEGFTWIESVSAIGPTYYDTTAPAIWQAPNGLIVTAWHDTDHVRWKASYYDYTLGNDPDGVGALRQGTAAPLGYNNDQANDPAVWTDGHTIVVINSTYKAGVSIDIEASCFGTGYIGESLTTAGSTSKLFRVDPVAAGVVYLCACIVDLPQGGPMIGYLDNTAAFTTPMHDRLVFALQQSAMSSGG